MRHPPLTRDPEVMHGVPCFVGTRVPIRNLFELIAHGRTVDYFLEQFPTVDAKRVERLLEWAGDAFSLEEAGAA